MKSSEKSALSKNRIFLITLKLQTTRGLCLLAIFTNQSFFVVFTVYASTRVVSPLETDLACDPAFIGSGVEVPTVETRSFIFIFI